MLEAREGITALAEQAGIAPARAKRVLDQAGIRRDKYRKYDTEEARAALDVFTSKRHQIGNRLAGRGPDAGDGDQFELIASARAAEAQARARKLTLEADEKAGLLISREAAIKAAEEFAHHVRNGLLGVANKAADRCAGRTADQIAKIIDEEIRAALADLSDADRFVLGT